MRYVNCIISLINLSAFLVILLCLTPGTSYGEDDRESFGVALYYGRVNLKDYFPQAPRTKFNSVGAKWEYLNKKYYPNSSYLAGVISSAADISKRYDATLPGVGQTEWYYYSAEGTLGIEYGTHHLFIQNRFGVGGTAIKIDNVDTKNGTLRFVNGMKMGFYTQHVMFYVDYRYIINSSHRTSIGLSFRM